jgi:hypothetical protein
VQGRAQVVLSHKKRTRGADKSAVSVGDGEYVCCTASCSEDVRMASGECDRRYVLPTGIEGLLLCGGKLVLLDISAG